MAALTSNEHRLAASSALRAMQKNPDPKLAQTYALKAIAHMMAARELPDCEYCKYPYGACICPEPGETVEVYNPATGQIKHSGSVPVIPGERTVKTMACKLRWIDSIEHNHIHECYLYKNHEENCLCTCGGAYFPGD